MYSDPVAEYAGKVAVVTGGTNGNLGPIFSEVLRSVGMRVFSLDLPEYDVRKSDDIRRAMFAAPDIPAVLVNNAAIDNPPIGKGGYWDAWDEIMEVNLKGTKLCSQIFSRNMIAEKGGGLIINVASIMAKVAADWHNYEPGFSKPGAYNVSKSGIAHLTTSMQGEFGRNDLRCCCIAFGPVDTGKFAEPFKSNMLERLPLRRFISPQSVRETLLYPLRCPEFAGQMVLCDAGYTCW